MKEKVSVIIPAKNRPEFTAQAIASVIKQKIPTKYALEVIVVDNRSNPTIKSLLGKKFPKVKFVRNDKFDSPGGSRNKGLSVAKGNIIAFLDNDDQWKEGFLDKSLSALNASKAPATLCLTDPYFYGDYPTSQKIKIAFLNLIRTFSLVLAYILNSGKLPQSGFYLCQISHMVFDKKFIEKLKFNERAVAAEDWEFIVGATKKNSVQIILSPLVKFRYEMRSNTNTEEVRKKKWGAYMALLKKIPSSHKKGIFHKLFLKYIALFS